MTVTEAVTPVDNPWDDPDFVALYQADVALERDGKIDDEVTREEFLAGYSVYLRAD